VSGSRFTLDYRNQRIDLEVVDGRELVLSLDGVARKRRRREDGPCATSDQRRLHRRSITIEALAAESAACR
jgi:hypothetical protein